MFFGDWAIGRLREISPVQTGGAFTCIDAWWRSPVLDVVLYRAIGAIGAIGATGAIGALGAIGAIGALRLIWRIGLV